MALIDAVLKFRESENEPDPLKATWYLAAGASFAGAGAGSNVLPLYRSVTAGLPLETAKLVQRRLKEALLKSTIFVGVPRVGGATSSLYGGLKDEEIDDYAPRFQSYDDPEEQKLREIRGKAFFDILWTPAAAEGIRTRLKKYNADAYLLNQKLIYEFWCADDRILNNVETELVAIAALVPMNCPEQLKWHLKGAIRHGCTREQVQIAYDMSLLVAKSAGCQLGEVPRLEDLDLEDTTFN